MNMYMNKNKSKIQSQVPQKPHRLSTVQPPVERRQTVEDILQLNTSRRLTEQAFNFLIPGDLNMYYCGKQVNVYNHRYGPAIRDHYLFVFIVDGHGLLETHDMEFELNSNNLLVMFPDNKIFYEVDAGTPWTIQWLGLYGKLADRYLDLLGITPVSPVFPVQNPDEIKNIMEVIYRKSSGTGLSDKIDCISLLHRFFACLAENAQSSSDTGSDGTNRTGPSKASYIEHSLNYMKYNYEQGITSIDIANNLKIDRSYFSKIFKQETGQTPTKWLTGLRIGKACKLLQEENLTISEVAYSVGLFDQFYFSRLFKAETGLAPAEYRKQHIRQPVDFLSQ